MAQPAAGQARGDSAVFYAAVGGALTHYELDLASGALRRHATVTLPVPVQYAWQHVNDQFLYVIVSNGGPDGGGGSTPGRDDTHHAAVFRIGTDGALTPHGPLLTLPHRPIHASTDINSEHLLTVYSRPAALTVHRINADGTLGARVPQPADLDLGIYPHQVRVAPSNALVMVCARGHNASASAAEQAGALKLFKFAAGVLRNAGAVAPGGGFGFGPRHLDIHPDGRWVVVSLERQSRLDVFRLDADTLSALPVSSVTTLARPAQRHPQQMAGTVHVLPKGRFVVGAERINALDVSQHTQAGEDGLVVCAIDAHSGALTVVQHVATSGRHPRTFSIEPSGQWLIAASKSPVVQRDGSVVPACLDVFRIAADGRLSLQATQAIDVGAASIFWSGFVRRPA